MNSPPLPPSPDKTNLLIDFPVRLYTALRTIRLYPASNPQVHRSNDFVLKAFQALLQSSAEESVNIALFDQKILVCGEHLSDKDQMRPQIQGLITLLNRLQIHSFTFLASFSLEDCVKFTQTLADLLGNKELTEPISALLERAGIASISVDTKRYVAVHEGEQVVREEMIGSGLNISDEELANFVLGKTENHGPLHAISPELIQELINRLPEATGRRQAEAGISESIIELLQNLSRETNLNQRAQDIRTSATALSDLDPVLLSRLVAHLPATPVADEILNSTLQHLTPPKLNALISNFIAQQAVQTESSSSGTAQIQPTGPVDLSAFNRMLGHYEQLLSKEQQMQVAQQAGAQLASMEGLALGNIIAQKFKGLFGEQLYRQVITQVSDELLDETVDHLTPKQLNRMIATLTSDIPLQIGKDKDPEFMPADDAVFKRLAHTKKGPEISTAIAQNIDARQLLLNPDTTLAQLPEQLLQRLRQPEWSAPVLATAAQQIADPQVQPDGPVDLSAFNRMLGHYEQLLSKEQQTQVAQQAGAQLASMEGLALGNIIAQKFKGLFGEQLYRQVITQVSDELLDETVDHLTPKQLNRMIATLTSDIPLQIGKDKDPEFMPADDAVFKRLAHTKKGPEISTAIAQNIDARQLLLNPDTTLAQLPEQLLQRLRQPEWSAPVLATAAQQIADPQVQPDGPVDLSAFNRMLGHYEQLLSKEQQTQVAQQAGAQLASMEGLALGNIIAQKFKGLFGEQLYRQVITQVSDELLDETVDHLTPKQLNRMIATLTSDIPLQIGKDKDPEFMPADDAVFKRLAHTKKGPEISTAIAQNIDARQLLLNPDTTLAQLPEQLLQRLRQPEWSAPVLATAAQQIADPQVQPDGPVDLSAFNRMLGHYEQLLSKEQQTQVAQQAGAQLASMEGLALGNIIAQKFKGLFGEQLYRQVITQVSDELLDETVDHLTPKQLNRMIATLTSDIPLQIGKDKDPEFMPADDAVFKRLAHTKKGPEISTAIAQNIDARILQALPGQRPVLPERLAMRLQQPEWSAPVLVTAAQQSMDPVNYKNGKADFSSFEGMLDTYDTLLNKEKQLQVATQAGSHLASFDEKEIGLILVQKYKNLFGEQLYQQVINQLSDEKFEKIADQLQAITEGREALPLEVPDKDIEEAYKRLLQTVRGEKMRAIIAMSREQKNRQEQERRKTTKGDLDNLLQGDISRLEKEALRQSLPEIVKNLLNEGKESTADNLLMQLAVALQHPNPSTRTHAASTLAAIAEALVDVDQWQRIGKLLPALKQGLQREDTDEGSIRQTLNAIGGLTNHYLAEGDYDQAIENTSFLQTLTTAPSLGEETNPRLKEQALEALNNLCSQPVLEQLLNQYLHSDTHREAAGKLLVAMGGQSAKFQLQQLMSNERRFERKQLLSLIKQTGNTAISILLEQLHKESPWFVIRNIVRLLGEIGNPSLFETIRPFIEHSDLRVQEEVINTAIAIGDEHLKDFLLQALHTAADPLKIKVVNQIAATHDERFVRPLTDLLESTKPFLGKNQNDLQLAICKTLETIGSKRATASLHRVVQSKKVLGLGGISDEVRQAAGQALQTIREVSAPQKGRESDQEYDDGEKGIYEIDSQPLGEIIRSGEIIAQEKQGAISEDDPGIWAELTDRLTSEEFQTLYPEFIERRYKPEETIVSQGDKNDALFFITQGSIKVSHKIGDKEIFITSLNRGHIAGENFFTPSLWTVSLTSLTPSRIHILQQATLNARQEQFPGLRNKLQEFYTASNNIQSLLKKKGLDRRKGQRFTLSRKIQVIPITTLGTTIGRGFRAESVDISRGGLAFLIRISKQENARLLLGRQMQVVLPVGGQAHFLYLKGMVISIQPYHIVENDFSVHFKFEYPLDPQKLQSILG